MFKERKVTHCYIGNRIKFDLNYQIGANRNNNCASGLVEYFQEGFGFSHSIAKRVKEVK